MVRSWLKGLCGQRVRDDTMARHFAADYETYSKGTRGFLAEFWGDTSDEIMKAGALGGYLQPSVDVHIRHADGESYGTFRKLKGGRLAGGTTSGGCKIVPDKDGVLVVREIGLVAQRAIAVGRVKWDGRFDIDTENSELDCRIGTLGTSGLRAILDDQPELRLNHLPKDVFSKHYQLFGP